MDIPAFWAALETALADLLADPVPAGGGLRAEAVPTIALTPGPTAWPAV
jgi:hypothetical protein